MFCIISDEIICDDDTIIFAYIFAEMSLDICRDEVVAVSETCISREDHVEV